MQRLGESVAGTIMTADSTNRHNNSVCPYFLYFLSVAYTVVEDLYLLHIRSPSLMVFG
jgi:hypothetical protein